MASKLLGKATTNGSQEVGAIQAVMKCGTIGCPSPAVATANIFCQDHLGMPTTVLLSVSSKNGIEKLIQCKRSGFAWLPILHPQQQQQQKQQQQQQHV